ncbi:MAG: hypothetical protein ACF8MF_10995 [Phycisphaerales bacterium JB052]
MRFFKSSGVMLGLLAGTTMAGSVNIAATLSDNSQFITNFQLAQSTTNTVINKIDGVTSGSQMNFSGTDYGTGNAIFDVNVSSTDGLNYFLGDVANLYGGSNANWFDGGGASRPVDGTFVLAFGNTQADTNSNEVVMNFNPGVTAFAFNYDDLEPATLSVTFRDSVTGILHVENINANSAQGFISFVAAAGETIDSITLTQNNGTSYNDGFSFYDFQTIQAVPLPAPVLAGLGMLGGLGVARRLRRS